MSLKDIRERRQKSAFVGREEQLNLFQQNLFLELSDPRRRFIFNIHGQGGVGKTTLLENFRKIVRQKFTFHAYIDETQRGVPEVMAQIAEQLAQQGYKLRKFRDRYRLYRQCLEQLEADSETPKGFAGLVGRGMVKVGLGFARGTPAGGLTDLVDEDVVAEQAQEWIDYAYSKLKNKDEVQLVRQPLEVLTPLFLEELHKLPEEFLITLFFDTYERTEEFLDSWLRDLIDEKYGACPTRILMVIAGREELDKNLWDENESLLVRLPLEPFTEAEARDFLSRKGITDEASIEVIFKLSGKLPLLVATLAAGKPEHPSAVIDPTETAIERFLKWVEDDNQRQVALNASLPRMLNRDVLGVLVGDEQAHQHFTWLTDKPFVSKQVEHWTYHSVVREQMLRYQRTVSGQNWSSLHGKLASYYETLQNSLELPAEKQYQDATWQSYALEVLYHRLCESSHKFLKFALNGFVAAFKNSKAFARRWAETMKQVGEETGFVEVQRWGKKLLEGVIASEEKRYEPVVKIFEDLLKEVELEKQWRGVALNYCGYLYRLLEEYPKAVSHHSEAIQLIPEEAEYWADRGTTYFFMKRYEEAIADFNRAIELKPEYQWAIAYRGETYRLMERYEEALADFNRAIELKPEDEWAIALRGLTYRLMERYEEALVDFNRAIELKPEDEWAIALRGLTYRLMERYQEAIADFNRAIELKPEYALAIALRGFTYLWMERYEEALADFNCAIELKPEAEYWANRGETYRLMERYEEALADFNCAIELKPEAEYWANRGETYRLMERYEEALVDLNRAIELKPEDAWNIANRGKTYRLMKRYEEALVELTVLLNSNQNTNGRSHSEAIPIA
ncbi:tetratricopeptide repeat protein [Lyngbya aestuarii]|uniref:tetratricopeptide repeat protein n=1 Tax=Lyngbya aestuarii TaxID=118322 RepID=UPI00403E2725